MYCVREKSTGTCTKFGSFALTNYRRCGCCLSLPKAKCFSFLSNHRVNVTDNKASTLKVMNIKHMLRFNLTDLLHNKSCGIHFIQFSTSPCLRLCVDQSLVCFQPENNTNTN